MRNPLRTLPRIQRVATLVTVLVYCTGLVGALTYLSYRLIWAHPSQVQKRCVASLATLVTASPGVEGGVCSWSRGTTLARIDFPSPVPARRDEASWLSLDGVRVGPPGAGGGPGTPHEDRRLRMLWGRFSPDERQIEIDAARLFLEHGVDGEPGAAGWLSGWNVQDLVHWPDVVRELRRLPLEVSVARVQLRWREPRSDAEPWTTDVGISDLVFQGDRRELVFAAGLEPCRYWSDGDLEGSLSYSEGVTLKGRLDGVRSEELEHWLALIPAEVAAFWRGLRPRGSFYVTLERLAVPFTGARAVTLELSLGHYDSSFHLPRLDIDVKHVSGESRWSGTALKFGTAAALEEASAEVWGAACRISGEIDPEASRLELSFREVALERLSVAAAPRPFRPFLRRFAPRGLLSGTMVLREPAEDGDAAWRGDWDLGGVEWGGIPPLGTMEATLSLQMSTGGILGSLKITKLELAGFGNLEGVVSVSVADGGWEIEATNPKVTGPGEPADGARSRTIFGRLKKEANGRLSGWIEWSELGLESALLNAASLYGRAELSALPATPGGGGGARLTATSRRSSFRGRVVVPAGVLEESALAFDGGSAEWTLTRSGLTVEALKLSGSELALRARGRVAFDGAVDFLVLVARGEEARKLDSLGPTASPPEWWSGVDEVPDTGGEGAPTTESPPHSAYRLGGTLDELRSRRVGRRDAAFRD